MNNYNLRDTLVQVDMEKSQKDIILFNNTIDLLYKHEKKLLLAKVKTLFLIKKFLSCDKNIADLYFNEYLSYLIPTSEG